MSGPFYENTPDYYRIDVEDMRIEGLVAAHAVWAAKCSDGNVPVWGDLEFLDFDVKAIPYMMLLDVDGEPGFGHYRFWGSQVASADGRDMTNLRVSDLAPPRHAYYSEQQYRWVVESRKPSLFVACLGESSWDRKFEAVLRMPCRSAAGADIDRVVSVGFYDDVPSAIADYIDQDVDLTNYFDPDG